MLRAAALALALLAALPAQAELVRYTLDPARSRVGFTFRVQGVALEGTMPVRAAEIAIDWSDVRRTTARVTLDAAAARASLPIVTEAMRGPEVLDTARHPTIRFESARVARSGEGASLDGSLTIRGVTRPVRLSVRFAEAPGAVPGDRARITVLLSGRIDRTAFGAAGFPGLVDDRIDLAIRAGLDRID